MRSIVSLFALLTIHLAHGFDRMECESKLDTHYLATSAERKKSALSSTKKLAIFNESESKRLFLKDQGGNTILTISPWNSLHTKVSDSAAHVYKFKIDEFANGFEISATETPNKNNLSLKCRFSF